MCPTPARRLVYCGRVLVDRCSVLVHGCCCTCRRRSVCACRVSTRVSPVKRGAGVIRRADRDGVAVRVLNVCMSVLDVRVGILDVRVARHLRCNQRVRLSPARFLCGIELGLPGVEAHQDATGTPRRPRRPGHEGSGVGVRSGEVKRADGMQSRDDLRERYTRACRTFRTRWTYLALWALGANLPLGAGVSGIPLNAGVSLRTLRTVLSCCTVLPCGASLTSGALRTRVPRVSFITLGACGTCLTRRALWSFRSRPTQSCFCQELRDFC